MADRFRNRPMMNRNHPMANPRAGSDPRSGDRSSQAQHSSGSCNCKATLHRLQTIDFSLADVILYLDAYPYSAEAKAYYSKLLSQRQALVNELAEGCHMPITALDEPSSGAWHWIDGPWPWSIEAN